MTDIIFTVVASQLNLLKFSLLRQWSKGQMRHMIPQNSWFLF